MENDDKRKYSIFFSNLKAETIINESGIDVVFESIYSVIISKMQRIIHSVIDHNINISKYNHFGGSSYIKLLKELNHS